MPGAQGQAPEVSNVSHFKVRLGAWAVARTQENKAPQVQSISLPIPVCSGPSVAQETEQCPCGEPGSWAIVRAEFTMAGVPSLEGTGEEPGYLASTVHSATS